MIKSGAIGMTCEKLSEAEDLCDSGIEDILIANQIVDPVKIRTLADLANKCRLTVCVDTIENIRATESQKEEIVAEGIAIAIAERFSLSVKDIAVKVTLGGSQDAPTLEYVKVSLQNEASYANVGGILRYVKNNYTENCEVIPHAKE